MRRGGHCDIFPTLFNLSLSGISYYKLGNNLLGTDNIDSSTAICPESVVITENGAYNLHSGRYYKQNTDNSFTSVETLPDETKDISRRVHLWKTVSKYVVLRSLKE